MTHRVDHLLNDTALTEQTLQGLCGSMTWARTVASMVASKRNLDDVLIWFRNSSKLWLITERWVTPKH